jgi:hypothetical protein
MPTAARINIAVPAELKSRMTSVIESINWSAVVRPCIESELVYLEQRRGDTRDTASIVERLNASHASFARSVFPARAIHSARSVFVREFHQSIPA